MHESHGGTLARIVKGVPLYAGGGGGGGGGGGSGMFAPVRRAYKRGRKPAPKRKGKSKVKKLKRIGGKKKIGKASGGKKKIGKSTKRINKKRSKGKKRFAVL